MKNILVMTLFLFLMTSTFSIWLTWDMNSQGSLGSPVSTPNVYLLESTAYLSGDNTGIFNSTIISTGGLSDWEWIGANYITIKGNSSDANDSIYYGSIIDYVKQSSNAHTGGYVVSGDQIDASFSAIEQHMIISTNYVEDYDNPYMHILINAVDGWENETGTTVLTNWFSELAKADATNISMENESAAPTITFPGNAYMNLAKTQSCSPLVESEVGFLYIADLNISLVNDVTISININHTSQLPAENASMSELNVEGISDDGTNDSSVACSIWNNSNVNAYNTTFLVANADSGAPSTQVITNMTGDLVLYYNSTDGNLTCTFGGYSLSVESEFKDKNIVKTDGVSFNTWFVGFDGLVGDVDEACGNYSVDYQDWNITYYTTTAVVQPDTNGSSMYIAPGSGQENGTDGDILLGGEYDIDAGTVSWVGNVGIRAEDPELDLIVNGSLAHIVKTVTADHNVAAHDYILNVNTSGGGFYIYIGASDDIAGRVLIINDIGSSMSTNNVRIDGSGAVNIGGAGYLNITVDLASVYLIFDGLGNVHIMEPFLHSPTIQGTLNVNGGVDATASITTGGGLASTAGLNISSGDSHVIDLYAEDIEADAVETDELTVIMDSVFNETEAESMDTGELTVEGVSYLYGNVVFNVTAITSNHTTTSGNNILWVNTSTQINVTMDSYSVLADGVIYTIKDGTGNAATKNIIIDTDGGETIDGELNFTINGDWDSIDLFTYDGNWFIR